MQRIIISPASGNKRRPQPNTLNGRRMREFDETIDHTAPTGYSRASKWTWCDDFYGQHNYCVGPHMEQQFNIVPILVRRESVVSDFRCFGARNTPAWIIPYSRPSAGAISTFRCQLKPSPNGSPGIELCTKSSGLLRSRAPFIATSDIFSLHKFYLFSHCAPYPIHGMLTIKFMKCARAIEQPTYIDMGKKCKRFNRSLNAAQMK